MPASAVIYVANIAGSNVSSGNWTASGLPAGTKAGDLVVACIACRNTETMTANSTDWTTLHTSFTGNNNTTASSGKGSILVAYHRYKGTNPDFVFLRTGGDAARGTLITLRGAAQTNNGIGNTSLLVATAATVTANTGTLNAGAGSFLLMVLAGGCDATTSGANAATDPVAAGWTERYDANTTTGSDTTLMIATATKGAAGATGTFNCTSSVSSFHVLTVTEILPRLAQRYNTS